MIHCENFKSGLLGKTLQHSFSPKIHSFLADYEYKLYEVPENGVEDFLKKRELDAFNVTIPYKKTVMPYLTYISDTARKIGSVNTVVRKKDGLYGYNTDFYGFSYMLKRANINPKEKKVLVLGSGGASLTVKAVLEEEGAEEIITVSRSGEVNYSNVYNHRDANIIVNTTPVGMYPENGTAPVDLKQFKCLSGVVDLIYNPSVTRLLYDACSLGIPCVNGLSMLVAQAEKACEIFLDTSLSESVTEKIVKNIEYDTKNIVLIGMPGAGKTTAGKCLAKMLNRPFVDTDALIVEKEGMSIPDIFSSCGESVFREKETEAAAQVGKMSGAIIATGGGIVTREENHPLLSQNSVMIWLKRDISSLPINGRPISKANDLNELYAKRKPLYDRFSDISIEVSDSEEETAQRILTAIRSTQK